MKETNKCEHCGGDIAIRNPSGYCDHLYYPESCNVCKTAATLASPETWEGLEEKDVLL